MKFQDYAEPLGAMLKAPAGYTVAHVLLTTYSLHKRLLADLLLHCHTQSGVDLKNVTDLSKRMELESAYQRWKDKVLVLADHVYENYPDRKSAGLDEYINEIRKTCVRIQPVEEGCFHPKLILVCFEKQGEPGDRKYRLMVSSKNLTYDTYFQVGTILEGEAAEQSAPNGQVLYTYMESFPDFPQEQLETWAGIKQINFCLDGKPVQFLFTAPGKDTSLKDQLRLDLKQVKKLPKAEPEDQEAQEKSEPKNTAAQDRQVPPREVQLLIITDSLGPEHFFDALGGAPDRYGIVSNPKSWFNLLKKAVPVDASAENDANTGEEKTAVQDSVAAEDIDGTWQWVAENCPYIHAKQFVLQTDSKRVIYMGSANCSRQALEKNYECMIRLEEDIQSLIEDKTIMIDSAETKKTASYPIRALRLEDLNRPAQEDLIESFVKSVSVDLTWDAENHRLHVTYESKAEKPKSVGDVYLCPPNQKRRVEMQMEKKETVSFACRYSQLPDITDPKMMLLVENTSIEQLVKYDVDAKWIVAPQEKEDADYGQDLYKGLIPQLKDVIPAGSSEGRYKSDDSEEERLAKYFGQVEESEGVKEICKRAERVIQSVEKRSEGGNEDAEDDDEDEAVETDMSPEQRKMELDAVLKRIRNLVAALKEWSE